jgi:hypothetical protein
MFEMDEEENCAKRSETVAIERKTDMARTSRIAA